MAARVTHLKYYSTAYVCARFCNVNVDIVLQR